MNEKASILIVDDDESTRRSLKLIFEKKGYETAQATTGCEALDKVQAGHFDVVILDIKLPDIEGSDLLVSLKEKRPDMGVIMSTAYASVDNVVQALNNGAAAYITKPLNMEEMLAVIKGVIELDFPQFFQMGANNIVWTCPTHERVAFTLFMHEPRYISRTEIPSASA
jgi:DNA-binding response OmpR family regulator